MSEKLPPKDLRGAIKTRDIQHLRNAGRKGAEVANKNRDIKKTLREIEAEEKKLKALDDERHRATSANEHLITPDGEDLNYIDDAHVDGHTAGRRL